ncbi:MAG: NAD(P)H-dependent glycerol-3-phosphate dehydrogenase [Pseudomonadota bacterium]
MALDHIAVIGAGAWGTALAVIMAREGRDVVLWARRPELAAEINRDHQSPGFLPQVDRPGALHATPDLAEACAGRGAILLVVPSTYVRELCRGLAPHAAEGAPVILCAKGVEAQSGALMSEIAQEELPDHPVGALSGPTFAAEVARGLPTAITLSIPGTDAPAIAEAIRTPAFRPYLSDDLIGVQIGGAVKNVIAIASGIATGLKLGSNAQAALITRGLAEIARLAVARGARAETLMGLSGLGDLALTCSSPQSRNMAFGIGLGEGLSMADLLSGRRSVVEGIENAQTVTAAARAFDVELPICEAVNAVLHHGTDIKTAIRALLDRPLRSEV